MRIVGALLAGLAAAIVMIVAIEFVSSRMYHPQPVATMPPGAFGMILLGWFLGTFAGAFLAARIGRSAAYGFVIGALLLGAAVTNMLMIPHPPWFWAASLIVFVVTTLVAVRSALPARAVGPEA